MFGLILPSRPCLTLTPLTPTTYTLAIPPTPPFTHLVVFLLPGQALPTDTAAAVYIRFPPSVSASPPANSAAAANEFRFLGAIGNEKPSAIFRVRGYDAGKGGDRAFDGGGMGGAGEDEMVDEGEAPNMTAAAAAAAAANGTGAGQAGGEIQLGVAIEPLPQILASLATLASQSSSSAATAQPSSALTKVPAQSAPVSTKILARRIIRNAFNFLASFAGTQSGAEVVPLKAFQEWWVKFERRVENDPGFLEREGEDG